MHKDRNIRTADSLMANPQRNAGCIAAGSESALVQYANILS